jgi:TolB-like protein
MCCTIWKASGAPTAARGAHMAARANQQLGARCGRLGGVNGNRPGYPFGAPLNPSSPDTDRGWAGIPALTQGKYVAVLPFRVLGDQESLGYVAEGLSEALSARLFEVKDVHVVSSTAADKVGEKDPPEKIARELGANLLVHGTVQGTNVEGELRKIAFIVNLDDVSSGRRLWSGQDSGVAQDLLALEDQIVPSSSPLSS